MKSIKLISLMMCFLLAGAAFASMESSDDGPPAPPPNKPSAKTKSLTQRFKAPEPPSEPASEVTEALVPVPLDPTEAKCRESFAALTQITAQAKNCVWSSGSSPTSAPIASSNLCVTQAAGAERQKICVGEIRCDVGGNKMTFPNVLCRATEGDCMPSKCLNAFPQVALDSCKNNTEIKDVLPAGTGVSQ